MTPLSTPILTAAADLRTARAIARFRQQHERTMAALPAYEFDPADDPLADWLELRDYCAAYYGVRPETLSDSDVQRFASLTGCGVQR